MKKDIVVAYVFNILKYCIFGSTMLFTSSLLKSTGVFDVLALRFLMSAVVFTLLILTGVLKVNYKGKKMKNLILTALFEPVIYFIFENIGIAQTNTSTAGLILAAAPALTIIFETVFLGETTTWAQKEMIFLRISAAILIVVNATSSGTDSIIGIICISIAGISGALFGIFSRKSSQDFNAIEVTYLTTIVGAVAFNAINVVRHLSMGTISTYFTPYFDMQNMIGFVYLAVVSSIVATMMGNYALGKMQATVASAFSGASTIVTILLGVFVNKEPIGLYHYVAMIMMVFAGIGMAVLNNKRSNNEASHK